MFGNLELALAYIARNVKNSQPAQDLIDLIPSVGMHKIAMIDYFPEGVVNKDAKGPVMEATFQTAVDRTETIRIFLLKEDSNFSVRTQCSAAGFVYPNQHTIWIRYQ